MVSDNSSKSAATPPSNSSKVSFDSTLTPQRFLDVDALQKEWSPKEERIARSRSGGMKVRSLDGNKRRLRGGDFILNKWDAAATIGFCFKDKTTKKKYGITVAHLADHCHSQTGAVLQEGRVGDKLYVFLSDEPDDTTGEYEKAELGKIVSLERSTDSMVFEVEGNIEVESYVLHPCLGLQTRISLGPFEMGRVGTTLVGFGAQRRGTLGRIMEVISDDRGANLLEGDLCILSFDPNSKKLADGKMPLTDEGDCGMLFLDEHSRPWGMHHVLMRESGGTYKSCCVPFRKVLGSHPDIFQAQDLTIEHQSSPPPKRRRVDTQNENAEPAGKGTVLLKNPLVFKTKLVTVPPFCGQEVVFKKPLQVKTKEVPLPVRVESLRVIPDR